MGKEATYQHRPLSQPGTHLPLGEGSNSSQAGIQASQAVNSQPGAHLPPGEGSILGAQESVLLPPGEGSNLAAQATQSGRHSTSP